MANVLNGALFGVSIGAAVTGQAAAFQITLSIAIAVSLLRLTRSA